jgi:two-component system NarL family sensor kinase
VLNGQSISGAVACLKTPPENGATSPIQRNILLSAAPLRNDHGSILGCTVTLTDITERRQAEAMLRESELDSRLMEQTEQERLRIARNLHDGPLQDLISLSFSLQLMMPTDQTDPSIELVEVRHNVLKLIQDLRMACNELRPSSMVRFGLAKAIRNATEDFTSRFPGLKIDLDLNDDEQLLSNDLRMAFLRIYQESLNNIARHANASAVDVRLRLDESGTVSLKVEDNGSGFILPQEWVEFARLGHLGLVGMRERIEAMGGGLKVVTSPGNGTIILVSAPVKYP